LHEEGHQTWDQEAAKMFGIGPTEISLIALAVIVYMIVRNHKARRA
jgi:hypothetical protein